jgi:hypothetical protein
LSSISGVISTTKFGNGKAVADPLGPYVYTLQNDGVRRSQIDPLAGGVTALAGSPVAVGARWRPGTGNLRIRRASDCRASGCFVPRVKIVWVRNNGPIQQHHDPQHNKYRGRTTDCELRGRDGSKLYRLRATPNCPVSLTGGASCSVSVVFSPSLVGPRVGALSVADNASASPRSAQLSGTGDAHREPADSRVRRRRCLRSERSRNAIPIQCTPSGTSTIVLQPSAVAANGKPVGTILPIQLTLTVPTAWHLA